MFFRNFAGVGMKLTIRRKYYVMKPIIRYFKHFLSLTNRHYLPDMNIFPARTQNTLTITVKTGKQTAAVASSGESACSTVSANRVAALISSRAIIPSRNAIYHDGNSCMEHPAESLLPMMPGTGVSRGPTASRRVEILLMRRFITA